MSGHGEVQHDYHLVSPSPWPVLGALGVFLLAVGGVTAMKGLFGIAPGTLGALLPGLVIVLYVMTGWWRDVIKEGRQGDHKEVVDLSLRMGMVLFIVSEVMFFFGWFWSFFEMAIFHTIRASDQFDSSSLASQFQHLKEWAHWPPMQTNGHRVETFDPFGLPLVNTLILLLSGTTVTWAHHSLQKNDRKSACIGLALTVGLGLCFTALQGIEYAHAHFSYDGSLYGSAFFMATGFHGAHVIIGTLFLAICLLRMLNGGFTPDKHLGLEFAAWYWHFVDVVWLFLFVFVYVTPRLAFGG